MYRFALSEIEADPTVQRLFRRRALTPAGRRSYVKGIRLFCEYFAMRPKDLLEELKGKSEDELVEVFSDWLSWAKDIMAPKTLTTYLPGIKAWLLENGLRAVDRISREIFREARRKFGRIRPLLQRDIISKEEIKRLLEVAPLREKAIIATMASSGLRLGTCLRLQVKHFKDDLWDESLPCYCLEIPGELTKERESHVTFISAEAAEWIRELLERRRGEEAEIIEEEDGHYRCSACGRRFRSLRQIQTHIGMQHTGEEIGPETYLFVTQRGKKPLSTRRFENIWPQLCKEAGIERRAVPIRGIHTVPKKGGGNEYRTQGYRYAVRPHALRKFFKTSCSISGVDRMASEAFLGHSLLNFGIESVYDYCITHLDWLRSEYLKVLPNVTFIKALPALQVENHEARKRISELEERMERMETAIKKLLEVLTVWGGPAAQRLAQELKIEKEFEEVRKKKGY